MAAGRWPRRCGAGCSTTGFQIAFTPTLATQTQRTFPEIGSLSLNQLTRRCRKYGIAADGDNRICCEGQQIRAVILTAEFVASLDLSYDLERSPRRRAARAPRPRNRRNRPGPPRVGAQRRVAVTESADERNTCVHARARAILSVICLRQTDTPLHMRARMRAFYFCSWPPPASARSTSRPSRPTRPGTARRRRAPRRAAAGRGARGGAARRRARRPGAPAPALRARPRPRERRRRRSRGSSRRDLPALFAGRRARLVAHNAASSRPRSCSPPAWRPTSTAPCSRRRRSTSPRSTRSGRSRSTSPSPTSSSASSAGSATRAIRDRDWRDPAALDEEAIEYCRQDARDALELWQLYEPRLRDAGLLDGYRIIAGAILPTAAINLAGMLFDRGAHSTLVGALRADADRLEGELTAICAGAIAEPRQLPADRRLDHGRGARRR